MSGIFNELKNHDFNYPKQSDLEVMRAEYKTGQDLVGEKVEHWFTNKLRNRFRAEGIVIKYRKSKSKKMTCNYLVEFPPTINQKEPFKMWFRRSSITQI